MIVLIVSLPWNIKELSCSTNHKQQPITLPEKAISQYATLREWGEAYLVLNRLLVSFFFVLWHAYHLGQYLGNTFIQKLIKENAYFGAIITHIIIWLIPTFPQQLTLCSLLKEIGLKLWKRQHRKLTKSQWGKGGY